MKSSFFCYPYERVFELLQTIIKKKHYSIATLDADHGDIKAVRKKGWLGKVKALDIKVFKVDADLTGIRIMINTNQRTYVQPVTSDDVIEDALCQSINRHF